MGIQHEWQLVKASGMSQAAWDEALQQKILEGKADALTEEKILAADPDTRIEKEDEHTYFIGASKVFAPVKDEMDAYRLAYSLAQIFGGSEKTDLRLWSKLQIGNETVYSFQQLTAGEEALGNTMKIAVDEDGTVSAIFGNLSQEADSDIALITHDEAEEAVRQHLEQHGFTAQLFPEETQRIILSPICYENSLILEEEGDPIPDQVAWVVYSRNEDKDDAQQAAYPFVAHYVTLDGTYLKSLPVAQPGDEESLSGYRKEPVFENMIPATFTGEVKGLNDETRTITVPVMKSTQDGKYYLGDLDRRIAVADFWDVAYGDDHALNVVSSETNDDWDNEDLYMYYNYIRAWDFYNDMGWTGPDGQKTDVLILKDLCFRDKKPFENACSLGKIQNWQMFGYTGYSSTGEPLHLVDALDVMAHEYTHTFTSTVMNENLYRNDLGAINEAMSDIMGNLVEYIYEDTTDEAWLLGENSGDVIRSMSDPHKFFQPEHVWDCYYGPKTTKPNAINDEGGVHGNSSLLNRIAALLCIEYGMSYEDAVAFWTMTAMGMTPLTDYPQMPALMSWALEKTGNEEYLGALDELIEEEDLTRVELPEQIPLDEKVVRLSMPDTETFEDENWVLLGFQFNTDRAGTIVATVAELLYDMVMEPDNYTDMIAALNEMADHLELKEAKLKLDIPPEKLSEGIDDETLADIVSVVFTESVHGLLTQTMTWEEEDTREMVMVQKDYPTFYVLLNATDGGARINGASVLLGGRWYDLSVFSNVVNEATALAQNAAEDPASEEATEAMPAEEEIEEMMAQVEKLADILMSFLNTPEEEDIPEETTEEENDFDFDGVIDGINNLGKIIDYYLTPEEERPEGELADLLTHTSKPEYLPVAGLDQVKLFDSESEGRSF